MAKLFNLARMTTATTGTGTVTLGSAVSGYISFASAGVADGDVVSYGIKDGTASEVGTGTYTTSGTTLSRTLVNSTTGSLLNLSGSAEVFVSALAADFVGRQTIWIPAGAMIPRTTNGAAVGTLEMTTNKNMFKTLDFDTATQEFAQFEIHFPKSWNLGTVTFQPVWSHAATTVNFGVVWALEAVARSDDDAGDVAFGTAQTSTDTGGTTNDIYIAPESAAITIAGTPALGDTVQFQVKRVPADGSDTMAIDARLHGIRLFFTTNSATDA